MILMFCSFIYIFGLREDDLKILGIVTSFDLSHFDSLQLIFEQYLSMCEAGWVVKTVILSSIKWSNLLTDFIKPRYYCFRKSAYLDIRIDTSNMTLMLASLHRRVVAEELENFDVFVYQEDDIIFKYAHLIAYLEESKKLQNLYSDALRHNCIGFLRYRRVSASNVDEKFVLAQERFEEQPHIIPYCYYGQPYLSFTGNTHQAFWVLTQSQIKLLNETCNFLSHPPSQYLPR